MKLFQIYEEDLAALEQLCPEVLERCIANLILDNALRVKFRRIQDVLQKVRWNYGPPTHVESIPAGDEVDDKSS